MMKSPISMDRINLVRFLFLAGVVLFLPPLLLHAGEARLKNGMVIEGKPVPIQGLDPAGRRSAGPVPTYPLLLIETGMQRYFVGSRQVESVNKDAELARYEKFEMPPHQRTNRSTMLRTIGLPADVTEFDEFGRRRITFNASPEAIHVFQGITEIGPKYVKVTATNYVWEHGIATTSIPPDVLDRMLRTATDQQNPEDRMAIARFYLQAGMYMESQAELGAIARNFPELRERIEDVGLELRTLLARRLLTELEHRRKAGQHRLAYQAAHQFPTDRMSESILRQVRELVAEYDRAAMQLERAQVLLGEYQAKLDDPKLVDSVVPMRSAVSEKLDYESLGRLDAFLKLADDETLPPADKLALAYSGWMLGSANAVTDLDKTLRLWEARFLIQEFLRETDYNMRNVLLGRLAGIESVDAPTVMQMIEHLPPVIETPHAEPGKIFTIEVDDPEAEFPVTYSVLLPQEYNPHHRYPMIVALRPGERTTERELVWWGGTADQPGQSQRHGYIVIAPDYVPPDQRKYDYGVESHYIVRRAIRDARKRFQVDSDRVFLAGHGMGGDAAFDIGLSHPDLFAGVISIAGVCNHYCKYYWKHAERLPFYVVLGELDRDTFDRNVRELNRMMRYGYDVLLAEYVGRGYESYYEEIHKLFDWMDRHKRTKYPREYEVDILRPTDDHFYWVKLEKFPPNVMQAVITERGLAPTRPMPLTARVSAGNTVQVTSGADRTTIWLSPEFVDFEQRVKIQVNRRQRFNDFLRPDIGALLEDLRLRGDRQKLYTVRMTFE